MTTFKVSEYNGKLIARTVNMPVKNHVRLSRDKKRAIISAPNKFAAIMIFVHYCLS
jgi:hypothetical protein